MVKWEAYDETLPRNAYEKVHYDQVTDDLAMDHQGFKDRDAVRKVIPPRGAKVLGFTTSTDYKVECTSETKSMLMCTRGSAILWN